MARPTSPLDRRGFLKAGAAATLGLAGVSAHAEDKPKSGDFGGFTVGIQSYTFRKFKLEPALERTKKLGLHFVEFYNGHVPLNSSKEQLAAVKKLSADYGVTPIAFGVEGFTKDTDANRKKFEFAKELGVKYLSASPSPDAFDSLDKLVEEYQIRIAIHPHGPTGRGRDRDRWWSAEVILAAVKDHSPMIGTCLDTGHLIRMEQLGEKLDPVQQIKLMGARNFGLHLKDHDNAKKEDVVLGKGVLDVPGVMKALKEVAFKGYISIEYEAHPDEPTEDVQACLAILKDAANKGA